ncbi:tyrosine-type recombinase/integrase [Runella zeae]|uniref:tyrosine-type recombinase/integrase n=1 Tax=Runella zeae TaxID=94255 RepID=UPI002353B2CD|nr:site-specific integrase [Runella zeae]
MKYSVKLYINKQRTRPDGTAALYFQVILNRVKTTIPVNLYWPVENFDNDKGEIVKKSKNDKLYEDYLREIDRLKGEINEVFIWARLSRIELTVESFKSELKNQNSRNDFIAFWAQEIEERKVKGIIKGSTAKSQANSLQSLKSFRKQLPFSELTKRLLEEYKSYLINIEELEINSVWTKFKDFRTYLNLAKSSHHFEYPFKGFKMPKLTSRIEYLSEDEFQRLKAYFYSGRMEDGHDITLRAFLFACYTGLRIGDLKQVNWREVKNNVLVFKPQKQPREMTTEVEIPLCIEARKLLISKKGKLVETKSDQSMNRVMKTICVRAEVYKDVSFHWARHTFATRFLRQGGRLEVLQKLLGHADIDSTMIYVHVDLDRMTKEISFLT